MRPSRFPRAWQSTLSRGHRFGKRSQFQAERAMDGLERRSQISLINALNAACEAARERWRADPSEDNLHKYRKILARLTDFMKRTKRIS